MGMSKIQLLQEKINFTRDWKNFGQNKTEAAINKQTTSMKPDINKSETYWTTNSGSKF